MYNTIFYRYEMFTIFKGYTPFIVIILALFSVFTIHPYNIYFIHSSLYINTNLVPCSYIAPLRFLLPIGNH